MNQTPASILILTASILAYSATSGATFTTTDAGVTTQTTAVGFILGLASMLIGIWGVISLIMASVRDRELMFDGVQRPDLLGMFDPRRMARPYVPVGGAVQPRATTDPAGIALTPEMKAQLSMASHLEGRERAAIVEEALRRYLPRYENSTKAA